MSCVFCVCVNLETVNADMYTVAHSCLRTMRTRDTFLPIYFSQAKSHIWHSVVLKWHLFGNMIATDTHIA